MKAQAHQGHHQPESSNSQLPGGMTCATLPIRFPAENFAADLKTERSFSYFGRPDRIDRIYINCSECKRDT